MATRTNKQTTKKWVEAFDTFTIGTLRELLQDVAEGTQLFGCSVEFQKELYLKISGMAEQIEKETHYPRELLFIIPDEIPLQIGSTLKLKDLVEWLRNNPHGESLGSFPLE